MGNRITTPQSNLEVAIDVTNYNHQLTMNKSHYRILDTNKNGRFDHEDAVVSSSDPNLPAFGGLTAQSLLEDACLERVPNPNSEVNVTPAAQRQIDQFNQSHPDTRTWISNFSTGSRSTSSLVFGSPAIAIAAHGGYNPQSQTCQFNSNGMQVTPGPRPMTLRVSYNDMSGNGAVIVNQLTGDVTSN